MIMKRKTKLDRCGTYPRYELEWRALNLVTLLLSMSIVVSKSVWEASCTNTVREFNKKVSAVDASHTYLTDMRRKKHSLNFSLSIVLAGPAPKCVHAAELVSHPLFAQLVLSSQLSPSCIKGSFTHELRIRIPYLRWRGGRMSYPGYTVRHRHLEDCQAIDPHPFISTLW